MTQLTYVDGMLVDWGAALFNQSPVTKTGSKKGLMGVSLRGKDKAGSAGGVVQQGRSGGVKVDARAIRSKLGSISRKAPEVMVKITPGVPKGMRQIKDHLDYISRNGRIDLEDEGGNVFRGKDDLKELREDWAYGGFAIPEEGRTREAFNIVLSMPEGTDELAVKRAVRDFAAREFEGFQYVMAAHTFDTDPDPKPSKHPHVHLSVKARGEDGTRLNPRKADLQRWREGFAEALREHGVEAAATNRQLRLKRQRGEKQSVRQIRDGGGTLHSIGRSKATPERIAKAKQTEERVLKSYRQLCNALTSSDDAEDRKLAVQLVRRLGEGRSAVERDQEKRSKRER